MISKFLHQFFLTALAFCGFSKTTFDPEKILASMTLEEKAAQLLIVATSSHEKKNQETIAQFYDWASYNLKQDYVEDLIKNHKIGGVIFYGHRTTGQEQADLIQHLQTLSPKIPLFMALDTETGLHNRLEPDSVTYYPNTMALGSIQDPALITALGREIGEQLKALGVHIAFSPVVDVNCNPHNPIIGVRSFGSDPEHVARYGTALMQGLQETGIIACAKHFPGHGDTTVDSHEKLPLISHDRERLEAVELYPFQKLIDAGVKSIMLAHLEIPHLEKEKGMPSTVSYTIVTELLQKSMNFKGLVITDALGMGGATRYCEPGELEVKALQAGVDICLCPVDPYKSIACIVQAVKDGHLEQEVLDQKVLKVLRAKQEAFMHHSNAQKNVQPIVQSPQAKELQKKLYQQSITIAKSTQATPFLVQEKTATLVIQESQNEFASMLEHFGMPAYLLSKKITPEEVNTLMTETNFLENTHIIIALLTTGNRHKNQGIPKNIFSLIDQLKGLNKQVSIVTFGSPYTLSQFEKADTLVAAYQATDCALESIADVICGRQQATGKLPITLAL